MHIHANPQTIPMVLNRDHTLRTVKGHAIAFSKDVAVPVPKSVYADAVAIGAVRADGNAANVLEDENQKPVMTPEQLSALLNEALEGIRERNEREDFTAMGVPTVASVTRDTGEKYDARTIADAWKALVQTEE